VIDVLGPDEHTPRILGCVTAGKKAATAQRVERLLQKLINASPQSIVCYSRKSSMRCYTVAWRSLEMPQGGVGRLQGCHRVRAAHRRMGGGTVG
jgi:hypothetical protein